MPFTNGDLPRTGTDLAGVLGRCDEDAHGTVEYLVHAVEDEVILC